ncbi:349_t:CDS:2, partial [Scutellospora calospora]
IKAEALVIKDTDFDTVATSRNLTLKESEFLKLDLECSVADTMALKCFYMWNFYSGNGMSIEDWNKLCDKDFVEYFSPLESRKHFLCLSYFYKQGYNEESSLGFTGIDDKRILSDDQIKVAFKASHEKFIEIRSQALLLFSFRSRVKKILDLKSAIKAINAIVGNCRSFNNQEEVIARKLNNPEYCPIASVLPSYKPKVSNEIQNLFEYVEHKISDSSSGMIDKKGLSLEMPAHNQSSGLSQDRYHIDTTISEARIVEKKIPESLTPLSSEFLIKNESDIDTLILLL